jgi:hypothetical protein
MTTCGDSEIEITQVQFDLDKLPRVESGSRKSSISTQGSAEFEEVCLFPDSIRRANCRCRGPKLQPKLKRRSIEIHLPRTTSLNVADGVKKSKYLPPAPSIEKLEEKRHRCSKSEERLTRSRRSGFNHDHQACRVKREMSRIRKISSLSAASDDGKLILIILLHKFIRPVFTEVYTLTDSVGLPCTCSRGLA